MDESLLKASLLDGYRVPGFRVRARIKPHVRDPTGLVIVLARRQKKTVCGGCGKVHFRFYDRKTSLARDLSSGDRRVYVEFELRRVDCEACGVKQERLELLASNTKFTKRLALSVGGRCRAMPIKGVAKRMNLDWHTVKELEKDYMREQLALAGPASPRVIGIDEIAIKKRHTYGIVVSDLERRRAIWFGGEGRSEADMDRFYAFIGQENREKIRLAIMDMWSAERRERPTYTN